MQLAAVLLTLLIASAAELPPELRHAPPAPAPIPDDSPPSEQRDGGLWVPTPTDRELQRIIEQWRRYPRRCQARLDAQAHLLRQRCAGRLNVCRADCDAEQVHGEVAASNRLKPWVVAIGGTVLGVAAAGLGVGVGYVIGVTR